MTKKTKTKRGHEIRTVHHRRTPAGEAARRGSGSDGGARVAAGGCTVSPLALVKELAAKPPRRPAIPDITRIPDVTRGRAISKRTASGVTVKWRDLYSADRRSMRLHGDNAQVAAEAMLAGVVAKTRAELPRTMEELLDDVKQNDADWSMVSAQQRTAIVLAVLCLRREPHYLWSSLFEEINDLIDLANIWIKVGAKGIGAWGEAAGFPIIRLIDDQHYGEDEIAAIAGIPLEMVIAAADAYEVWNKARRAAEEDAETK